MRTRFEYLAIFALICFFIILIFTAYGRQLGELRVIKAIELKKKINIDGILDDEVWQLAEWQGDFIQLKPSPGMPARAQTRVAIALDNTNIYALFHLTTAVW